MRTIVPKISKPIVIRNPVILKKTYYYLIIIILIKFLGGVDTLSAQKKNDLSQFQLYSMVEKCQQQLREFNNDLNVLKQHDVPVHFKDTTISLAQRRFALGGNTFVQSDLDDIFNYSNSNELELSTYLIDYQISKDITGVRMMLDSSEFTIPRKTTVNSFIMYIGYEQQILGLDAEGDSLGVQERLALFQINLDSVTASISTKIASITFLDPRKKPPFEKIPAREMETEFKAYRNKISAEPDSVFSFSSDLGRALLSKFEENQKRNEAEFNSCFDSFSIARNNQDYKTAALNLLCAKEINNWESRIQSVNKSFQSELKNEIQRILNQCEGSKERWEYDTADSLALHAENLNNLFQDLFAQNTDLERDINNLKDQTQTLKKNWAKYLGRFSPQSKLEQLKTELNKLKSRHSPCEINERNDSLAIANYLLALIEEKSGTSEWQKRAKGLYAAALNCKSDFTYTRIRLIKLSSNRKEKLAQYEGLIHDNPLNPEYYFLHAKVLSSDVKDYEKSIELLERTISLDSDHVQSIALLGELYSKIGQYEKSISACKLIHEMSFDIRNALFLTFSHLELGQINLAENTATSYRKKVFSPSEMTVLDSLAQNYIKETEKYTRVIKGQYSSAITIFEKMYILVGHLNAYGNSWISAAECYLSFTNDTVKTLRAVELAEKAAESTGNKHAPAYLVWGRALNSAGEFDDADDKFRKLCELDPLNHLPYYMRGLNLLEQGKDIPNAIFYFQNTLEKAQNAPRDSIDIVKYRALLKLGQCYRIQLNFEKSIDALEEAIKLFKDDPRAHYDLGITLLEAPDEKLNKKSINSFEHAKELNYSPYLCIHQLAQAYFKTEKYIQSLEFINQISEKYRSQLNFFDRQTRATMNIYEFDDYGGARNDLNALVSENPEYSQSYDYKVLYGIMILKESIRDNNREDTQPRAPIIDEAKNLFQTAIDKDPEKPIAYIGLSFCNYFEKNMTACLKNLQKALNKNVNLPKFQKDYAFRVYFKDDQVRNVIKKH